MRMFPKVALAAALLAMAACGEKKKDDTADESSTPPASNGGGGTSEPDKSTFRKDVTALATVESGMLPTSLKESGASLLGGGPCAGTAGFFDCQPNLLRVYLGMAKQSVSVVQGILASVTEHIAKLGVGEGSVTPQDGKLTKISYKIESEDTYELLFETADGPFMYFKAAAGTYELKGDMGKGPDGDGDGQVHVTVAYTDEDTYATTIEMIGRACDASDIRAPENAVVKVTRDGAVWKGKAHLYLPRWLVADGTTCDLTPTDSTKMFIDTDFVGSDEKTTAALYMASLAATTTDALTTTYPASQFCTNFPSACNSGHGFGDPNPVADYKNNFCIAKDTATAWGANCTADGDVGTGTFGPAADWVLPDAMDSLAVTLPTAL